MVGLILGYNGALDVGERVLAPARAFGTPLVDMVGPLPYAARNAMLDVPFGIHGIHRYWKSGVTTTLSDALIDAIIEGAERMTSPISAIMLFRVHGAAARVPSAETAFGLRQDQWDVNVVSEWTDPAECNEQIAWTRRTWAQVEPLISGATYVNHLAADDSPERVRASFGTNYPRLATLKRTYDPTNMFRPNRRSRRRTSHAPHRSNDDRACSGSCAPPLRTDRAVVPDIGVAERFFCETMGIGGFVKLENIRAQENAGTIARCRATTPFTCTWRTQATR